MNQCLACLDAQRDRTALGGSQQAGEPGRVAGWRGNHLSLVAFCVLGDLYGQRKAHKMSGMLSPHPGYISGRSPGVCNTCRGQVWEAPFSGLKSGLGH